MTNDAGGGGGDGGGGAAAVDVANGQVETMSALFWSPQPPSLSSQSNRWWLAGKKKCGPARAQL